MNDFEQFEQLIQRGYGCISIVTHDEIEKAFASAASHSADGGLSQRMFGTLLTWLQEREEPVFVAATAIQQSPPLSTTMAEKVSAFRRWAKGRCVPAG